jgi:hypothetical protein
VKKDIKIKRVEGIAMAVVPETVNGEEEWYVYFINLKNDPVEGVLIRSRGYGRIKDQKRETSTLRHLLGTVEAQSYARVELIKRDVFGFTNEFWVSFWHNGYLYDKKYIFVPESISPQLFTEVPLLGKRGVMIK